jgi:hypothetical protein
MVYGNMAACKRGYAVAEMMGGVLRQAKADCQDQVGVVGRSAVT